MADLNDGLDGKLKSPEAIRELRHVYQERMFAAQKELAAPSVDGFANWSKMDKGDVRGLMESEMLNDSVRMYRQYAGEAAANCARVVDILNWVLGTVN